MALDDHELLVRVEPAAEVPEGAIKRLPRLHPVAGRIDKKQSAGIEIGLQGFDFHIGELQRFASVQIHELEEEQLLVARREHHTGLGHIQARLIPQERHEVFQCVRGRPIAYIELCRSEMTAGYACLCPLGHHLSPCQFGFGQFQSCGISDDIAGQAKGLLTTLAGTAGILGHVFGLFPITGQRLGRENTDRAAAPLQYLQVGEIERRDSG